MCSFVAPATECFVFSQTHRMLPLLKYEHMLNIVNIFLTVNHKIICETFNTYNEISVDIVALLTTDVTLCQSMYTHRKNLFADVSLLQDCNTLSSASVCSLTFNFIG